MLFHTTPDRSPGLCFLYMKKGEGGEWAAILALRGEGNIPIFPLPNALE